MVCVGLCVPSSVVQVYEGFEEYKVATSVDVFGVLSTDPSLAQVDLADETDPFGMETASERRAHYPPPSLIPRLHAITVHHLDHTNPLLPWQLKCPLDSTGETHDAMVPWQPFQ